MSGMKKKNVCSVCKKTIIGNSFKFKSHLYLHNAVKSRFQCPYCSKRFFRADAYNKHVQVHSGNVPSKKIHICDYCDRGFVNKRNLIIHLKIHDDIPIVSTFKCMACTASYCEKRLLEFHIRKMHYNLNGDSKAPDKMLNETWIEPVNKTGVCVEMTKVNNNVIAIKKCHVKVEKIDTKSKDDKTGLKDYIDSIYANKGQTHYSKAICDYCNKEMLKKSLQSHIRERHLMIYKFKCGDCKLGFMRHYQLVNHVCGKTRRKKRMDSKMAKLNIKQTRLDLKIKV